MYTITFLNSLSIKDLYVILISLLQFGGYVMHNKFKKVSAAIMAMLLMASFSSCSNLGPGLSDSINPNSKKSASKNDNDAIQESVEEEEGIDSVETKYKKGIELLKVGEYSKAEELFKACGDYEYAPDLINVCKAEIEYLKGNYTSAQSFYSKVSEKAEAPDFNVQQKKANIASRIAIKKLDGSYRAVSNNITMTKYKKKKKLQWYYSIGVWSGQDLQLSCTENADGTFDVTGYIQFWRYTKFNKKESKIKKGVYKLPINLKNIKKFPSKIVLAKGVTLTYSSNLFVVNYSKTTKSGKTKVVYKSRVAYRKSK